MGRLIQKLQVVPAIAPVDFNTADNNGDYVSLKNALWAAVNISIGVTTGTSVVTVRQAKDVSGTGVKALAFTKYYMTGAKLKYTGRTGPFTVGETITGGTSGATAVVYKDTGSYLLLYTVAATAFTTGETITGGTSGFTATADGIGIDEDIMLPCTCSSTFTIPAVSNRKYWIEIDPSSLDVDNGFDCISVKCADASNGCIGAADYIIEPKIASLPMTTAIYD